MTACRRQAIIWTNAGILSIVYLGINFSVIFIEINILSFEKMYLKIPPADGFYFGFASSVKPGIPFYSKA